MDHTSSSKEKTSGLKVSSGSKTRPDWMCLDKQNRRDLPLRAIQKTGIQQTASRYRSFWINQQKQGDPVLIPLPSLSPSYFLLPIWFCSLFFFCAPDGKLYRNVFSGLLYSDQTNVLLSPPSCFTFYQASFQYLNTIFLQTWQAGDVTPANQCPVCTFSTILHNGNVAPQKTCSSRRTANILSQHSNSCELLYLTLLLFPLLKPFTFKKK